MPEELDRRLRGVREQLTRRRLDGLLVSSRTDQLYLTGFNGEDGLTLVTPRQVVLLSDFRFQEAAGQQAPWARFVMRKKGIPEELAKVARRSRMERLGYVADRLTVAELSTLRKALKPTGASLVKVPNVVSDLRIKKDQTELTVMREAIRVAEEAFLAMRKAIRIGQTEQELAARLNYEMCRRGAVGPSFPTVVAEGANAALPHAEPGERRIRRGSAVLFDWGAHYRGYCSDLTRMVYIGRIPPRIRRLHTIVRDAQQRALGEVRAGLAIRDLDRSARSHIAEHGYGKQFGHALGHGLGLNVHEAPGLSARNAALLEPGMVVTIEPGIYLPGVGGVRIEDDVLVTDAGGEVLSSLPSDLAWSVVDL